MTYYVSSGTLNITKLKLFFYFFHFPTFFLSMILLRGNERDRLETTTQVESGLSSNRNVCIGNLTQGHKIRPL